VIIDLKFKTQAKDRIQGQSLAGKVSRKNAMKTFTVKMTRRPGEISSI